jgi:arylsulfatase A-like enzyme
MLTGLHPLSHGAVTAERRIAPDAPMLPAELRRAGFATGGFVSYEFLRRRYGFDVGFDHYDDFTTDRDTEKEERSERMGPLLNAEIIPWIARHAERPFFLFIHYYDVHWNYDPPPPFDTMFDPDYAGPDLRPFLDNPAIHRDMPARHLAHLLSLYDGEIRFTDGVVGEVIAALERGGIADDTLLLITADHGDEFFEHGGIGHSRTLYDEVVRVPLIARWPNGLPAGHVVETPVSLVDLAPTVYDLVGVTAPAGIEGRSLAPLMLGAPAPARPVYAHLAGRKRQNNWTMVRDGDAKYLAQTRAPHTELYDVGADPREGDDRFAARAMRETRDERAGQLLAWLEQQWDAYAARPARAGRIVIDDRNTEKLRALGYVE